MHLTKLYNMVLNVCIRYEGVCLLPTVAARAHRYLRMLMMCIFSLDSYEVNAHRGQRLHKINVR